MSERHQPTFEETIEQLLHTCEYVLKRNEVLIGRDELYRLVVEVYEWIPEQDDPRSMGWVGNDGLP